MTTLSNLDAITVRQTVVVTNFLPRNTLVLLGDLESVSPDWTTYSIPCRGGGRKYPSPRTSPMMMPNSALVRIITSLGRIPSVAPKFRVFALKCIPLDMPSARDQQVPTSPVGISDVKSTIRNCSPAPAMRQSEGFERLWRVSSPESLFPVSGKFHQI